MIMSFIFQVLVKATLVRDMHYYAGGLLYCAKKDLDFTSFSQDELIKKGIEHSKSFPIPLEVSHIPASQYMDFVRVMVVRELTELDECLEKNFDLYDGKYIFDRIKPLFKLSKIIESKFEDRFGPGEPTANNSPRVVYGATFKKSEFGEYNSILSDYVKNEFDYFTYDELSSVYATNSERVTKLAILCAFKLFKAVQECPNDDMACSTSENSA
jgi:hypothetical protein